MHCISWVNALIILHRHHPVANGIVRLEAILPIVLIKHLRWHALAEILLLIESIVRLCTRRAWHLRAGGLLRLLVIIERLFKLLVWLLLIRLSLICRPLLMVTLIILYL